MATDPNEVVTIEHPKIPGQTAQRTRKQLERLKEKGWREVKASTEKAEN